MTALRRLTLLHLALHLLLGTAANAHADAHKHHKHHSHKQKQRPQEQHGASDYVIVGGGSAGCALAARLCTGLPHASITLLERSKPRNASLDLTVSAIRNSFDTWANPDVAERWQSEPNPGLDGRTVDLITGNTLGGTSGLFVQWSEPKLSFAASLGVDGLTESKAEELYARARSALGVTIPPPELQETYVQDWLAAARRAGVATPLGERAGDRNSESVNQVYADLKGRRRDSCTAYLLPLIAHGGRCAKNVKLIQNARARRVRLARKRAVGVEYVDAESGHKRFVRAKREVVSCAGPYGTPQLLQLSGIGPTELLRKYGIHVHKDLPVGKAAQARAIGIAASVYAGRPNAPENNETLVRAPETLAQFKAGKGGLLAVAPAATDGVYAGSGGGAGRGALTVTTWVVNSVLSAIPKDTPIFVVSCANNPESRATVQINGTDPETPPAVATNMLGTDDDAAEMVACLRYLNSIVQEMPPDFDFTQIAPEGGAPIDAAFVRATTGNAFHFTGAASVGTVLDAKLRVKGYENLRVIDAAAVPRIPDGAGPSSTVFVFAERGAELIIAAHKKSM